MDKRMNTNLIQANIKLQDENKILMVDNKMLQKRLDSVISFLKERRGKFKVLDLDEEIEQAINICEGNYFYDEKKKK